MSSGVVELVADCLELRPEIGSVNSAAEGSTVAEEQTLKFMHQHKGHEPAKIESILESKIDH
jgi:hypothetical protein